MKVKKKVVKASPTRSLKKTSDSLDNLREEIKLVRWFFKFILRKPIDDVSLVKIAARRL